MVDVGVAVSSADFDQRQLSKDKQGSTGCRTFGENCYVSIFGEAVATGIRLWLLPSTAAPGP